MSDPGTTRPFSPAELDAIEDALEQLHGDDAFVIGGLAPEAEQAVRERLTSYRAIGRLSRDVLSAYEAPKHVLDRVMTMARESEVAPTAAPEIATAGPSFWTRIRAAWTIPLVATVAAAALVVIVAVPMTSRDEASTSDAIARNENAPATPPVSTVSRPVEAPAPATADGRLAMAEPAPAEEEPTQGLRGGAVLDGRVETQVEQQRDQQEELEARANDADDELARARKTATKGEAGGDPSPAGPKAAPTKPSPKPTTTLDVPATPSVPGGTAPSSGGGKKPAEPPRDAEKTEKKKDADKGGTDALAKADALRRSGDCGSAVKLYESVRKTGTKAQRARALVGLALCAEREGDRAAADELLAKARADDASIDAYYESER